MTKIKGSLFGAGVFGGVLAVLGGCIVAADDGSSVAEEDGIFAEQAAAAAASQMLFGVAPYWNQTWAPPASGPANVDVVAVGDWLLASGFTATHGTKLGQILDRGKTPYFFGYIATSMTKNGLGSQDDCDGNSSRPLCQRGAAYLRAHIGEMVAAYRRAAGAIGDALRARGSSAEPLIHIEPDWYQFSQTAQTNALTEAESDDFMNRILGAIREGCPSCKVVIDFSPWFSPSATKWASSVGDFYDGWDRTVVKYVGLTGKQFPFTEGKIDNFTYREITHAVGLPLVVVDAYTFGGTSINIDSTWLNESNIAKAVDMGIAIIMLSQTGDVAGYDRFIAQVKGGGSSSSSSSSSGSGGTTSSSSSGSGGTTSSSSSGSGGSGGGGATSSSSSSSSSSGSGGSGGGGSGGTARVEPATASITITKDSDWGEGYCSKVKITNNGSGQITWTATIPREGTITNSWNSVLTQDATRWIFTGASYNATLTGQGASAEFGFCAKR